MVRVLLILMIGVALSSCSILFTHTPSYHAQDFIGNDAKNCGEVEPEQEDHQVEACILQSAKDSLPFYSWYWLMPVDSAPASGILLDKNGELFIAWYDSSYLFWGSIFKATKCSSWEVKKNSISPTIICTITEGEKAYLFGLEKFVQLKYEKR